MRTGRIRRSAYAIGITLALILVCAEPALGAEGRLLIRATAANFQPDLDYKTTTYDGYPIDVTSSSDTGWGLGVEFLATPNLGIALQYIAASPGIRLDAAETQLYPELSIPETLGVKSFVAGLNLHLTADRAVDLYVSPLVAYLSFDDMHFIAEAPGFSETLHFEAESDIAWGVGVGIDVPFGKSGWLATGSLSYLNSRLDLSQPDEEGNEVLGFDPFIISAGIGYKF